METERNTHLPSSSRPMMTSSGRTGTGFGIGNSRGSRPTSNSNNHNYSDINNMSNGTENLPLENRGTRRSGVTGGAGEGGYGYEHIDILSTSRAGVGTGTGRAGGGAGAAVGGGYGHINTYDKKLRPTSSYGLDRMASASAPVPVPKPLTPTSASTSVAAARTNTSVVKSHARSTSTANSGAARLASGLPLFLPPPLPLPLRSMMMMTKDEPNERGVGLENYVSVLCGVHVVSSGLFWLGVCCLEGGIKLVAESTRILWRPPKNVIFEGEICTQRFHRVYSEKNCDIVLTKMISPLSAPPPPPTETR